MKKVDSSVDCHALRCKARNDRLNFWETLKMWLLKMLKDSRICDEKLCFASARKGAYLVYVTAGRTKQSKIYRAKPNPPARSKKE